VLPSQPSATWREQVGLPIVEGLSYGCTIVTTTETGLAGWLSEHGHRVVAADADDGELAAAVAAALLNPVEDVVASLPDHDGRLAADAWMFG
jgi:glycosyltransferase involved in cell wall biosynthesis